MTAQHAKIRETEPSPARREAEILAALLGVSQYYQKGVPPSQATPGLLASRQRAAVEPSGDPLLDLLRKRESYRQRLHPLNAQEIERLADYCRQDEQMHSFGSPGQFPLVTLAFLADGAEKLVQVGGGDSAELSPELAESLRKSFLEQREIPGGNADFVAVGINAAPLISKYSWNAIGLVYATLGCVLHTLELAAAASGLSSVILYGARENRFWKLGGRTHVLFPAAVRIGRKYETEV